MIATRRHLERDTVRTSPLGMINPVSPIRVIFAIVVQPIHLVSDAHHGVVTVSATSCGLAYKNSSKDMLGVLSGRGAMLLHVFSSLRQ